MDELLRPQTILANGVELTYVEQGAGDPVVFVHGSTGDFRGWLEHLVLAANRYRAIAYSRRGHYPNAWPADYSACTPEAHAADLAALIAALGRYGNRFQKWLRVSAALAIGRQRGHARGTIPLIVPVGTVGRRIYETGSGNRDRNNLSFHNVR